jgi:hypothetical protein
MPSNPTTRPPDRFTGQDFRITPSTALRHAPGRRRLNLRRALRVRFLMPQERSRSRTSIHRAGQTTIELSA